jgi:hypothetical protein
MAYIAAWLFRGRLCQAGERFPALLEYLPYRKDDDPAALLLNV